MGGHSRILRGRMAAVVEADDYEKEEQGPKDEKNEHEPVHHLEHVVHHLTVLRG